MDNSFGYAVSPAGITIVGGGRWARVLTEVICSIVDISVKIFIYSPGNAAAMSEWASSRGFDQKIQVLKKLPERFSSMPHAVIVVNAVRDHEKAVKAALYAGGEVLVEKPISFSYESAQRLAGIADQLKHHLSTAHIFLFARYLENFSEVVKQAGAVTSLKIEWMDPASEDRYGEQKQYDAGLPVFADWLPHVLSMAEKISFEMPQSCRHVNISRGGASVILDIRLGDIPCLVSLTRNGNRRTRFMEVVAGDKTLTLDFSTEPGTISDGSVKKSADVEWQVKERPAASMLRAFLKGAAEKKYDLRLDAEIGLRASRMISRVTPMYYEAQTQWLTEKLASGSTVDEDVYYALNEIFQFDQVLSSVEVDLKIKQLLAVVKSDQGKYWLSLIEENKMPSTILQMAAL